MKYKRKMSVVVGIIASLYLALLAITGDHGGSALKYGKYIIIMIGLIIYYNKAVSTWTYKEFIPKYLGSAVAISLTSGVIIAICNTLLFLIKPSYSIQKYNLLSETMQQVATIDLIIIIETVVLGLITAFIIFPYHKNKLMRANEVRKEQPDNMA